MFIHSFIHVFIHLFFQWLSRVAPGETLKEAEEGEEEEGASPEDGEEATKVNAFYVVGTLKVGHIPDNGRHALTHYRLGSKMGQFGSREGDRRGGEEFRALGWCFLLPQGVTATFNTSLNVLEFRSLHCCRWLLSKYLIS